MANNQNKDGDLDDISVTSTASSEHLEEYAVEGIVAEQAWSDGEMRYLVKWEGYPESRNTWEPESSFIDQNTLEDWEQKRRAIARGEEKPYDVAEFDAQAKAIADALADRRARRRKKRQLLGLPVSSTDTSEDDLYDDDSDDEPLAQKAARRSRRRSRDSSTYHSDGGFVDDKIYYEPSSKRGGRKRTASRGAIASTSDSMQEHIEKEQSRADQAQVQKGVKLSRIHAKTVQDANTVEILRETSQSLSSKSTAEKAQLPFQTELSPLIPRYHAQKVPKRASASKTKQTASKPAAKTTPIASESGVGVTESISSTALANKTPAIARAQTGSRPITLQNRPSARASSARILPFTSASSARAQALAVLPRFAKRTGQAAPRVTQQPINVMRNWGAQPSPRKRARPMSERSPPPNPRFYKNLSSRRRAQLYSRNKTDLENPVLKLHSAGELVSPSQQTSHRSTESGDLYADDDEGIHSLFVEQDVPDDSLGQRVKPNPSESTERQSGDRFGGLSGGKETADNRADSMAQDTFRSRRSSDVGQSSNSVISDGHLVEQVAAPGSEQNPNRLDPTIFESSRINAPSRTGNYASPSEVTRRMQHARQQQQLPPPPKWSKSFGPGDIRHLPDGRYIVFGEQLVHLKVIQTEVGDVRLHGLDGLTGNYVYRLKEQNRINLWFRSFITVDRYMEIFRRRSNTIHSIGWVIGFGDSLDEIQKLATYLFNSHSAAVFNHPLQDITLLIYNSDSECWRFLQSKTSHAPMPEGSSKLRVVSRNKFPPPSEIPPTQSTQSILFPAPLHHPLPLRPNEDLEPGVSVDQLEAPPNPSREILRPRAPNEMVGAVRDTSLNREIDQIFREQFQIDYSRLSMIRSGLHAQRYYLKFPPGTENEMALFEVFLRDYGVKVFCDTKNPDSWSEFEKHYDGNKNPEPGCIIIHPKFITYNELPNLGKRLVTCTKIICWKADLGQPIIDSYAEEKYHLMRIFPHGGVIFLTEDIMLNDPHSTLAIIRWFKAFVYGKLPGMWKLHVRPRINRWLFEMAEKTGDVRFLEMNRLISSLTPGYPWTHRNHWMIRPDETEDWDGESDDLGQRYPIVSRSRLPGYGSRSEDDHPLVPKGLTQAQRNNDHLMEFYAGWAITKAENFRKFTVVSREPFLPRWKEWHHLVIYTLDDFCSNMKIIRTEDPGPKRMEDWDMDPSEWQKTIPEYLQNPEDRVLL